VLSLWCVIVLLEADLHSPALADSLKTIAVRGQQGRPGGRPRRRLRKRCQKQEARSARRPRPSSRRRSLSEPTEGKSLLNRREHQPHSGWLVPEPGARSPEPEARPLHLLHILIALNAAKCPHRVRSIPLSRPPGSKFSHPRETQVGKLPASPKFRLRPDALIWYKQFTESSVWLAGRFCRNSRRSSGI
jgi:hypothetical protein